jgi:hypothetical protein
MRLIAWLSLVVAALVHSSGTVNAQTLTCSTWQGFRTCTSADGYVSHESTWNGITTGEDNRGDHWSTSQWQDHETTTVTPRQER